MKTIIASIVIAATLSSTASAQYYYNNDYYYQQQESEQRNQEWIDSQQRMSDMQMNNAIETTCNGGRAYGPCSYR